MTRKGIACPSCGEEMPVGMASGRYCRAPLHAAVVENSSIILIPPPDFEWRARALACVVVLLLLAPLAVSGPVPGDPSPISFTWPMIHSGDEPHNLVLINSVLNDGDFDVAKKYDNSHSGGNQAGRKFGGWVLDHHVAWYLQDRYVRWWEIYETDAKLWKRDANEHPLPTRKPNFEKTDLGEQEYSRHSPGFAVVTSPFLVFFRGTDLLEPAALLATTLMTTAGFFAFCSLVRPYVANPFQAVLFGAVAYLGSPLEGILGLLLSWQHGILLVAPVLILSVFCVRRWYRDHQRDAILISAAVVSYWLLMGCSYQWWGGTCYSARLLIPVLPLMLAPMAMLGSSHWWNDHGRAFAAIVLLMVISVEFGVIAAFACEHIDEKHPVQLLW